MQPTHSGKCKERGACMLVGPLLLSLVILSLIHIFRVEVKLRDVRFKRINEWPLQHRLGRKTSNLVNLFCELAQLCTGEKSQST